jgi:hypothetical protein
MGPLTGKDRSKPKKDRATENAERRDKAREKGLPWYVDHGGGRGRKSEPTCVMTVEKPVPRFVCEVESPADGDRIVEVVAALMQSKEALSAHTAADGPEFQAWQRAQRALNRLFARLQDAA